MPVSYGLHDMGGTIFVVVVSAHPHCCGHSTEQIHCSSLLRSTGGSQSGAIVNSAALNAPGGVLVGVNEHF